VQTKMVVEGGASLRRRWEQKKALEAIQKEHWDYVVLQGQANMGVTFLVDGFMRINDCEDLHKYGRLFDEAIRSSGAKTVLYQTWSLKDAPERDQAMLDYAYVSLAKELHCLLVPAGTAWQAARKAKPTIELYVEDGSHPSPAGTYLIASCFFSTLLNESPIGAAREIAGQATSADSKSIHDRPLAKLDPSTATFLQTQAWDTCSKLAKSGGYPDVTKPGPPVLPTLPIGDSISPELLEGRWTGTTKLYPRSSLPKSAEWPAKMELTCRRKTEGWEFELKIGLGDRMPNKLLKVSNVVVQNQTISFVDPNRTTNGATPTYRAIIKGGKMIGIAEIKSKDNAFFAIGSWELHKE
jgi:hypothetical protein